MKHSLRCRSVSKPQGRCRKGPRTRTHRLGRRVLVRDLVAYCLGSD